jgi:hypothetical protein
VLEVADFLAAELFADVAFFLWVVLCVVTGLADELEADEEAGAVFTASSARTRAGEAMRAANSIA